MVKKTISRYCPFKVLWNEPQRPALQPPAHAVQTPPTRRSNLGPCPSGDLLHLQHGGAGRHEPLVHVLPAAVQDDGQPVQLPGHILCHPVVLQPAPAHPLSQLQARRSWYYHHDGECTVYGSYEMFAISSSWRMRCSRVRMRCSRVRMRCNRGRMRCSRVRMRCSRVRMRCNRGRMRCSRVRMRSSRVRVRCNLVRMRCSQVRIRCSRVEDEM